MNTDITIETDECPHKYMFVTFIMEAFNTSTTSIDGKWEASSSWSDGECDINYANPTNVLFQCEKCSGVWYGKMLPTEVTQGDTPIYVPDFDREYNERSETRD